MRNSILALSLVASAIMGALVGGFIRDRQQYDEVSAAWDDITVVADGTLVANPAYYAYHPEELAASRNVRIINNSQAVEDAAHQAILDTAFPR